MEFPLVTFTTDYGLSDAYVATMKAAVLVQCPQARLIDVTHQVPPQNVLFGSIVLERAVRGFPLDSIHVAVVDPGVGTNRRLLIVKLHQQLIVCPDNGLITWAWRRLGPGEANELNWRPAKSSATFHGRDILAPVAGLLAAGSPLDELSTPIDDPVLLKIAPAKSAGQGEIIHFDHFGNATSNIPGELLGGGNVRVGSSEVGGVKKTYGDVGPGAAVAVIGSSGLVEIAVRDGSAQRVLDLRVGDTVTVE